MMEFFAGSSNQPLASLIAQKLKIPIANSKTIIFEDGEIKPVVKENVRDKTCLILQSTSSKPNDYWFELFLLIDALRRESAKKIICLIPSFGYARQNQQHQPGEPVSAHVMVNFLESLEVAEVITVDLHDETMTGMFNIPITNLSALPVLASAVKKYLPSDFVVVSPDQGGIERARLFAQSLDCKNQIVVVEKKRNLDQIHQSQALQVLGDVKNKTVVIQDDVITSGRTVLNAVSALKQQGANDIYLCVVHQDFAPQTPLLLEQSPIKKMLITNSVVTPQSKMFPKLETVDISSLLAAQIKKIVK